MCKFDKSVKNKNNFDKLESLAIHSVKKTRLRTKVLYRSGFENQCAFVSDHASYCKWN